MKILYHHRIASKDGQYVHVEEIINSLKGQGHEVIIVAPQVAENSSFGSDAGFVDVLKAKLPKMVYEIAEFTYSFWAFIKLCIAVMKHKPDAIYERYNLFLPAGIWTKKLFGVPFLLEVNAPIFEERKKYDGIALDGLAKWSQKYCWTQADKILPVTDVLADYARALGVSEEKIQVIPNGINHKRFADSNRTPAHYQKGDAIVIGFVGFVREWHGLEGVLNLIHQLPEQSFKLLVVGDGPAVPALKQQAQDLGLQDRFFVSGIVDRDDMSDWLNVMDIALQPDVTSYASPLKMLEYMAKGKAILAPDTPNIRELLEHEVSGLLFDLSHKTGFVDGIERLCTDDRLRKNLGNGAKSAVESRKLTWDNNASSIVDLFHALRRG